MFDPNSFYNKKIREAWQHDAHRKAVKEKAKVGTKFKCACCGNLFKTKEVSVHHLVPIWTATTYDQFISLLFCQESNLILLCKACHLKVAHCGSFNSKKYATRGEIENHAKTS